MKLFSNLVKLSLAPFAVVLGLSEVPLGISRQIYCETCHVMSDVLTAKLTELDEKGLEYDEEVILILDVLCGKRNFRETAQDMGFPVDKMVRSCQAFHNKHDDKIEEAIVKQFHKNAKMGVWLCHEASDACTGVVRKNETKEEDQFLTDEAIERILKENAHKVKKPVVGFDPKQAEREKHFASKTVKTAGQPVKPTIKPGTIKSNIKASSNIHIEL